MPDFNLYQAYEQAREEERSCQAALETATANRLNAESALVATMPERVPFAVSADHPPTIQHVDGRIELVRAPFLGDPYPATA